MKVSNLSELRKVIIHIMKDTTSKTFPQEIIFNRGIEYPQYKITIEEVEEDFFVDSKGTKWMRVKNGKADKE